MKNLFISCFLTLILFSCETGELTQLEKNIEGTWVLNELIFGFSPPPGRAKPTYAEEITFKMQERTYSIIKNSKLEESGTFEILTKDELRQVADDRIVFVEKKEYATFTLSQDAKTLSLYQRTPTGATLADGTTFVYAKK